MIRMLSVIRVAVASVILMSAAACGGDREAASYSVSFPMQKILLERIAGRDEAVNTLIPQGADPETYEPSVSTLRSLDGSRAFFSLGTPGFEKSVVERVKGHSALSIVDCSQGINLISGTHSQGQPDPHIWSSVRNARVIADNMGKWLAKNNPGEAAAIASRLDELQNDLAAIDDSIARILAPARGASFVVMHPILSYFARDYGLNQIAMETEGKEASPRQLSVRMKEAASSGAGIMIHDAGHSDSQAKAVASQLGLKLVVVNLNRDKLEESLLRIAREIASSVKDR